MASWPKVKKVGSGGGGSSESTTSESGSEGKLPTPTTDSIKNNNIDRSHNKSNSNSNQAERFEYFSWVYHLGVNSIGREYRHFRFLFIRGKYVEMYKRDPRENPGIKPIRRGVIGNTLMVEELGRRKVNDHDFYVLKFYNRLDETKKGEIAFATAGDARKCMEAFYHAKQQVEYELSKGAKSHFCLRLLDRLLLRKISCGLNSHFLIYCLRIYSNRTA
ncbi:hypothetical protein ACJIZ3_003537 [Penstemon smallii]|uniref:Uncharacterized protein n=1 Tax=Penstemon smallii TaxID=265156 RepID=A0ABD3U9I0_9LAMI